MNRLARLGLRTSERKKARSCAFRTPAMSALAILVFCPVVAGCGAPTKSAAEVASLFNGDAATLQEKISGLCATLQARMAEPTLKNTRLRLDNNCGDAGLAALDLTGLKALQFQGFNDAVEDQAAKDIHLNLRTQLWLNQDLVGIASAVGEKMKERSSQSNKGAVDLGDSSATGGLSNLAHTQITIVEEPKFDLATFAFSMAVGVSVTGIVAVQNQVNVNAQLIDGKIAVHASTTADEPFKTSLLKNFETLILVTPHAGDVYVDAFFDAHINSVGIADAAVKSQIETAISSLVATSVDGLLTAGKGK